MKPNLIIFDCDGVLVDSERLSNQVFCDILNGYGLELNLEDMFRIFVGNSMAQCIKIIDEMLGYPPPDNFEATYRMQVANAFKTDLKAVDGVEDIIKSLDKPYCIASSGPHEKMQITLGLTGLNKYFAKNIYSTYDVENPKPYPDVYLHAAEQMGYTSDECLIIEDSTLGVQAGKDAGMYVIAYAGSLPEERLIDAGADKIIKHMSELKFLI